MASEDDSVKTAGDEMPMKDSIDLKLLSPSADVPASGLLLENLPVTTTIGELRDRVTAALPSHPPSTRQRLIYYGRVLQRDDDTLESVLGQSNVQQQRQHTLHLVLPVPSTSQAPPSSIPRPPSSIHPPSSIPRPSSVPPRANGAASPFRPANWPHQANSPQTSAPASAIPSPSAQRHSSIGLGQPPIQQPQPRSHTPTTAAAEGPGFRANIRAQVTANGQPVNLPPEVVNQLLNQHFLRNGTLPDNFFGQQQSRPRSTDPTSQPAQTPPATAPSSSPPSQQLLQQFMASVTAGAEAGRQTIMGQATEGATQLPQSDTERSTSQERGRPVPQDQDGQERELPMLSGSVPDNSGVHPPQQSHSSQPPQSGLPGPQMVERSGVNPDGSRWTMRAQTFIHPQNGPLPMPPNPFPQGFPLPMMPNMHPGMGMPIPIQAPIPGIRPLGGTPRSSSPARSVSEGPRRVGTPAADLQHRLMHTHQQIQNLHQMLGVLANGTMANGQAASPLSEEQISQIRAHAESMNRHIDGFGTDLTALANAHPGVRFQPEFAGLHNMFQMVQGHGRGLLQRVDELGGGMGSTQEHPRGAHSQTIPPVSVAAPPQPSLSLPPRTLPTPPAAALTPSTTSDTLSPSLLTRDNSPTASTTNLPATTPAPAPVQLHLLSDPTRTQHYLLVGPTGPLGLGQLPLDVLYPLLATQLPHDQLIRDFNRATQEMTQALQRSDWASALRRNIVPSAASQSATASLHPIASSVPQPTPTTNATNNAQTAGGPAPPAIPVPADAAAPAPAPNAPRARNANARPGQPDEMRDILAPIVRNMWLILRLAIFAWFFFSSGRGYGRLLILVGLGCIVYAINAGLLGQQMNNVVEGLRRHFREVVMEATQPPAQGNGAAPAGDVGTPEEAARRLMGRRQEGQRTRLREIFRQFERTIALGVASLWPGVGEAVVRDAETARREAERAAEEERKKKAEEDEARKKALEENESDKAGPSTTVDVSNGGEGSSGAQVEGQDGISKVNKGKEKAVEADVD